MKIGKLTLQNNLFLAPMAGITHPVFRWIVREVGGAVGFTEMISAEGLVRDFNRTRKYLDPFPGESPFFVQLFGADPGALAEAARIAVENGADLIDINMGCPVKKVVKAGAGAALMKDPARLGALLKRVRNSVACPLTVKIRSGWTADAVLAPEIAQVAQDSGVDAVAVHPRTVAQGFSGRADWRVIESVKKAVHIPVIGNGDIRDSDSALRMLKETGCDGILIGRGALGNPWIFRDIRNLLDGLKTPAAPSLEEREQVICRHLERNVIYWGEREGVKDFYRHLAWYVKGMKGCSGLKKQVAGMADHRAVGAALGRFFAQSWAIRPEREQDSEISTES